MNIRALMTIFMCLYIQMCIPLPISHRESAAFREKSFFANRDHQKNCSFLDDVDDGFGIRSRLFFA